MDPMDEDSDGTSQHATHPTPPTSAGPGGPLSAESPPPSTTAGSAPSGPASAGPSSSVNTGSATPVPSKRRRGLGVVTPTACTECRKKRAKCDGLKPCARCKAQKDVECVYEVPVRQSKENLRTEIDHLRRQQRSSDHVFAALVHPELWEGVLQRLRGGQGIEIIADWLSGSKPPPGTSSGRGNGSGGDGGGGSVAASGGGGGGGSNALSPYGRSGAPGAALATLATGFSDSAHAAFAPMRPMLHTLSPGSGHNHQAVSSGSAPRANDAADHVGGWGGGGGPYSARSQTVSTRSDSHPDAMSWSSDPRSRRPQPQSRVGSWVESQGQGPADGLPPQRQGPETVLATGIPDMNVPAGTWTDITSDSRLVQHLLALYFCWEYPTFASLSKEHFLEDFRQGRQRYCSAMLVNGLLALGCRFSSKPNTRANPEDPYTSGDHFFQECQRLFYLEENHHTLTTIQALGIMSIREASCGRDSESWYYAGQSIRLAIEMGLHRIHDDGGGDEDEIAVQSATFWGAFALDHAWSLATGSLPQCSCFPHLPPKPGIIEDIEASLWIPYTDDGAPLQRSCEQPSNVRSVYKCFCELSELVHQSLYVLHSPGRPLTSRDLLSIYTQYLNWYDRIPEVLRLGHNFTPAVLFAHMYYHFAILLLFRPLIKLRIIGSSISPRDVCCQAADAIQGLLRSYSQLYTLRRTPSFVPYFVLTSSITHLAIGASTPPSLSSSTTATPTSAQTSVEAASQPGNHQHAQHARQKQHTQQQPSQQQEQRQNSSPSKSTQQQQQQQTAQQPSLHIHGQSQRPQLPDQQDAKSLSPSRPIAAHGVDTQSQQQPDGPGTSRLPPNVAESISRGIEDLTEMAPCHHFAVQALNILRYLAKKWHIDVRVESSQQGFGGGEQDLERAVRPVTSSRNFFAPSVQEGDFVCSWGLGTQSGAGAASRAKLEALMLTDAASGPPRGIEVEAEQLAQASGALENPLFWPFPMQGRPMLPAGPQLEEAGFAIL